MQGVWLIVLALIGIQFTILVGLWQRRQRQRLTPILQLLDAESGVLTLPLVGIPQIEGRWHRRQVRIQAFERRGRPQLRIGLSSSASIFFTAQPRHGPKARGRVRRLQVMLQAPELDENFRFYCNSSDRFRATLRRAGVQSSLLALLKTPYLAQINSENGWLEALLLSDPQKKGWDAPRLRLALDRLHRLAMALEGKT